MKRLISLLTLAAATMLGQTLINGPRVVAGGINYCEDAGSTDAYACALSPAITAYATGAQYTFKAATANTGGATLALNGLTATAIVKYVGGVAQALADNDIRAGAIVTVVYDGTNFQLVSALGNGGSSYSLPTATDTILGGVKVGSGLTINDGVLAASGGSGGYATVKNQGTSLTQRNTIDFLGRGIVSEDGTTKTNVYVMDPSKYVLISEEFCGSNGAAATNGIGSLGIAAQGIYGFAGTDNIVSNHPCHFEVAPGSPTAYGSIYSSGIALTNVHSVLAVLRLPSNYAGDQYTFRIGLVASNQSATAAPTNGVWVEHLIADGTSNGWYGVVKSTTDSSSTRTSTELSSAAASTWYAVFIKRNSSGNYTFKVASTITDALDTSTGAQTVTSTEPYSGYPMLLLAGFVSGDSTNRYVWLDYMDVLTSITR